MPQVEYYGLLVTAVLAGTLIGGLATARSLRLARRAAHEQQFIDSLIAWLAARRAWRQSAATTVRAIRALAQEPRDSARFDRLCKSAKVSRNRFRQSNDKLTLTEAAMETWRGDALSKLTDPPSQPTFSQVRRVAMRGGADRLEMLWRHLELADKADLEWVRAERIAMRARRSLIAHFGVWAQRIVWKVVRAWERPR